MRIYYRERRQDSQVWELGDFDSGESKIKGMNFEKCEK